MMGRSGLLQRDIRRPTSSWTMGNEPQQDTHAGNSSTGMQRGIGGLPAAPPRRARLALVLFRAEITLSVIRD